MHTCYSFKKMWNNKKKYAISNIDNINTKMSEIQSVLDEIKKTRKHAKDGICFFYSKIESISFFLQVFNIH